MTDLLVLAAGMASRFGGLKQLETLGGHGEALLDYGIYDSVKEGYRKVVFIIRKDIEKEFRQKVFDRIAAHCDAQYVFQEKTTMMPKSLCSYAKERVKPYGTVQAVLAASKVIDGNFVIMNADDFYGRGSFARLKRHFDGSSRNAMVGYVLSETLGDTGTVNRGICRFDASGKLSCIEETYGISAANGVISGVDKDKRPVALQGNETASMNFFGFNAGIMGMLEKYWAAFADTIKEDNTQECLVPVFCNDKLHSGELEIDVYTAVDKWFGMTYKADVEVVKKTIRGYVETGIYPENLWGV